MIIIGGTYREITNDPPTDQVFGSGLRAAAAISSITSVKVISCVDDDLREVAETTVETYGLQVDFHARPKPISFSYDTPITEPPVIQGQNQALVDIDVVSEDQNVLLFGMLEAKPTVLARGIVYDPQGEQDIDSIHRVKLGAEKFAVVANASEIKTIGRRDIIGDAAAIIFEKTGADVIVVKRGALGVRVIEADGSDNAVECYYTDTVWPIGSGDVFSAVFAWAWLEEGRDAVEAARIASASASIWCGKRTLPIRLMPGITPAELGANVPLLPQDGLVPVYLAGPFFDKSQKWLINLVRNSLEKLGAKVFSPLHDVGMGGDEVAQKDIQGLLESMGVLGLLDGADPGTLYELGYAAAKDIPITGYSSHPTSKDWIMPRGMEAEILDDLPTAVYHAIWQAMK